MILQVHNLIAWLFSQASIWNPYRRGLCMHIVLLWIILQCCWYYIYIYIYKRMHIKFRPSGNLGVQHYPSIYIFISLSLSPSETLSGAACVPLPARPRSKMVSGNFVNTVVPPPGHDPGRVDVNSRRSFGLCLHGEPARPTEFWSGRVVPKRAWRAPDAVPRDRAVNALTDRAGRAGQRVRQLGPRADPSRVGPEPGIRRAGRGSNVTAPAGIPGRCGRCRTRRMSPRADGWDRIDSSFLRI